MKWIKWWKDKTILTIYSVVAIAIVLSFLTAYYLSNPFNWLLPILICIPCGIVIRKLIVKKLTETFEKLDTNN